jgi:RNA polymerase subunit RPABC4/transcription elongation factor Spt4
MLKLVFCHNCNKRILTKINDGKVIIYLVQQWNGEPQVFIMQIIPENEHDKERCPFCGQNNIQEDRNHKTLTRLEKQI